MVSNSYKDDKLKDVEFHIEDVDQEDESPKQVLKAHSFVLACASPVFQAMLYGPLAPVTSKPYAITIKNTTTRAFSSLLDHIYHKVAPQVYPSFYQND